MAHAQNYDAINTSKNKHCRYQIKKKKQKQKWQTQNERRLKKKKNERKHANGHAVTNAACPNKNGVGNGAVGRQSHRRPSLNTAPGPFVSLAHTTR